MPEILRLLEVQIDPTKKGVHLFFNPFSYLVCRNKFPLIRSGQVYANADGSLLVLLLRLFRRAKIARRSFDDTSIAPVVFEYCVERCLTVALVGSKRETISVAKKHLLQKYPRINITYVHDGYYSEGDEMSILEACMACDCVIVSTGSPSQESFLLRLQASGWSGHGYTCGGYFDQLVSAGGRNYYPLIVDKLNMRWAYRLLKEPKRLAKRYFLHYPIACLYFVADCIKLNRAVRPGP